VRLYLLRHAIAAPHDPARWADDRERPLTADGIRRMKRAARGIRRLGIRFELILSSPLTRALETARIVLATGAGRPDLRLLKPLAPGGGTGGVLAALTGFISGLLLSIPVGPVNLTIINEGARRGFKWAGLIGLGATIMEVIYCAIAFTGLATFFTQGYVKAAMELFSFVFMLFLGVKFLSAKSIPAATRIEERIEGKLHPTSAFMTGFVRVMGNPGVLIVWIILAANFISRGVARDGINRLSCIGGAALGIGLWFFGLSWAVSLGHRKFSEKTLLKMEHISGITLLLLAVAHGGHIVWELGHHRIGHGM